MVLCGCAQSGKDTFAAVLMERGFVNVKFATPLKDAILTLFPHMLDAQVNGDQKDKYDAVIGDTPRSLMQFLGTDLLQHRLGDRFPKVGRNVFVAPTVARMRAMRNNIVVTDMRFEHEKIALKEAFCSAKFVKIVRGGSHEAHTVHESESGVEQIKCDIVLHNEGTLGDFKRLAERTLNDWATV